MLAADQMRYHGADLKVMWNAFARRGMGSNAATKSGDSGQPKPGFRSPRIAPATVHFTSVSRMDGRPVHGKVYIGRWQARVTPVADTTPSTKRSSSMKLTPGHYAAIFAAKGFGLTRFLLTVHSGQTLTKVLRVRPNLASSAAGAKVVRSSSGGLNATSLIDDTESTSWAGVNSSTSVDARHPFVILDLAGGVHRIRAARVSAMLHPAPSSGNDPDSAARFTALRRFAIETCVQTTSHPCASAGATWKRVYTSPANAFPAVLPRPVAPNLALRTFHIASSLATHVKFVALENQCTGYSGYAGEQDSDPTNNTDCKSASDADLSVRAAELELFG
jgi:hypothetical protein